ncbi:MAG: tetratricopeptide repeat protein [Candidatus Heimdallarchaeota archaeon]|nr:MAG: tetratricopeptide repeat protein [Candidatus Heimdallarchaeota archaeon]
MPGRFTSRYFGRDKLSNADLEKLEYLKRQILKCYDFIQKGNYEKGLNLAEQTYKESEENENFMKRPIIVDTTICQGYALLGLGRLDECLNMVEKGENLLDSVENIKKNELVEKQAIMSELKAILYRHKGNNILAYDFLNKSSSIMEKLKEKGNQAGLLNNIAIVHASDNKLESALEFLQQSLATFEELNIVRPKLKVLNNIGLIHALKGELDSALEYYQKSLDGVGDLNDKQSEATLLMNIGQIYHNKGEIESAVKYGQKSREIFEKIQSAYGRAICLNTLGIIHELRGELYDAHDLYTKGFIFFKEVDNKPKIALSYNNIGNTYLDGGDVDRAISHYNEALAIFKNDGSDLEICMTLYNLISVHIQRGLKEISQQYLQDLQKINEKRKDKIIDQIYQLARALILKTSERVVKQAEAQQIFQKIIEANVNHEFTVIAKKNLCELLIQELSTSGDEEILGEIKEISQELLSIAEKQQSSSLLIETYILQSKMALLELDLDIARQLLSDARQKAEEKELQRLGVMVSREYDSLLSQLSKWTDLADRDVSLAERLELAELESMVTRLIRKKAEIDELSEEEPVLFLILARSGMSMFSKHFMSESLLVDQLIGGFLTAINAFTQQAFSDSGTIEGIKHREYTILMNPTDQLLCCYVFKGPSYYALQKLKNFSETVKVSDAIWEKMLKASMIGQDISGEKEIQDLVSKIILSSSEEMIESTSEVFFGQKMNVPIEHGIFLDIPFFDVN